MLLCSLRFLSPSCDPDLLRSTAGRDLMRLQRKTFGDSGHAKNGPPSMRNAKLRTSSFNWTRALYDRVLRSLSRELRRRGLRHRVVLQQEPGGGPLLCDREA